MIHLTNPFKIHLIIPFNCKKHLTAPKEQKQQIITNIHPNIAWPEPPHNGSTKTNIDFVTYWSSQHSKLVGLATDGYKTQKDAGRRLPQIYVGYQSNVLQFNWTGQKFVGWTYTKVSMLGRVNS